MIKINLLPEELRKKESVKIALPDIPIRKTLIWVGAGLVGVHVLLGVAMVYVHLEAGGLEHRIEILQEKNREVISRKAEITGITNRLKEIRSFATRKLYWTSLLNALSNSMTKGVWLRNLYVVEEDVASAPKSTGGKKETKVVAHEKFLVLEGSAVGAGQETALLGKFLKELRDNAYFGKLFVDIKPSNISQKRLGEYEVYDFVVRCRVQKEQIG